MDYKEAPELKQFMIHNVQKTWKSLGHGAFGDVEEIIMDGGTYCAGKVLHQAFLDPNNLGLETVLDKFVLECRLLADIRHPNIVQFMGICFFGENPYPVLVMEKLDTSLDALLEDREQLPMSVKLRILFDVSKGLVYLHHGRASPIVHRDLTTRNVLINKDSMNAKIADLGNARVIDKGMLSRSLTQAPGTTVYMPPEALGNKPDYTTSLDIFSFGHLTLFTINQIFPGGLLSPTYVDQRTNQLHGRSELDRRQEYMDLLYGQLGKDHAVSHMVEHCLSNRKEKRPTAKYIMEELQRLIKLQYAYDPSSLYLTASRRSNISRKSEPQEGKHESRGILEIERSKGKLLNKKLVWKQYIFQVEGAVLQYVKGRKIIETIPLNSIISVQTGPPMDGWFLFSVIFNGKGSPWNLRASSQEECEKWTDILSAKAYEVPVLSGRRKLPPTAASYKAPAVLQEDTDLYEEIDDKFADLHQKLREQPSTAGVYDDTVDDNTVKAKLPSKDILFRPTPKDTVHQVPPAVVKAPTSKSRSVYKESIFSNASEKVPLQENPDASFYPVKRGQPLQGRTHPTPENQIPPPEYLRYPSISPAYQKQGSDMKQEVQHYHTRDVSRAPFDDLGRMEAELPVPLPRRSIDSHTTTCTPMEAIQSQLQHQKNVDTTCSRMASTSSASDVHLHLSLEDMTKEQLLSYVQIIQKSQPASYLQPNLFQQEPSTPVQNERGNLYVNIMTDNFENQLGDSPPPLPPRFKQKSFASSEDLRVALPTVPPRKKGIPKSQSVLLSGSSAEAVRQRYRYKGRDTGGHVHFKLEEEDEDVFTPERTEHCFEEYPPVPPRVHRVSNPGPMQPFQQQNRSRPNIPQRSHTMKAYLPSINNTRKGHTDLESSNNNQEDSADQFMKQSVPAFHERQQAGQTLNIHEVRSMLGNVLMNAKQMSSDRYLNDAEEVEEEEERPQWATCMPSLSSSNQALTPEESLESLQRLALFIHKADLYEMCQIGKGQFGKVYRARLSRGRASIDVAVKTIKRYESEKERTEFLHEQAVMSQLAHPNVVRLYGLVQQESPWIVLEFLPNGDLKHFLIENERPIKTLLKYMLDVALGMHYISEKGLVHRDIAARNIMVTCDETCKVGDFGLLRELPKGEDIYVSVSKSPAPIRWMAPESLQRREFSTASDVWSYGVLLWEICQPTRLPYEGMGNYQCGFSVIQGQRLDVPLIYPPRVRKIMKACWHGIPTKRPSFLLIFNILTLIIFSTDFL